MAEQTIGMWLSVGNSLDKDLKSARKGYAKFTTDVEKLNARAIKAMGKGFGGLKSILSDFDDLPNWVGRSYTKAIEVLKKKMRPITQTVQIEFSPRDVKKMQSAVSAAINKAFRKAEFRMSVAPPLKRSPLFSMKQSMRAAYKQMVQPPDYKGKFQGLPKYKRGGEVKGGTKGTDSVLGMLEPGEAVVSNKRIDAISKQQKLSHKAVVDLLTAGDKSGAIFNRPQSVSQEVDRMLDTWTEQTQSRYANTTRGEGGRFTARTAAPMTASQARNATTPLAQALTKTAGAISSAVTQTAGIITGNYIDPRDRAGIMSGADSRVRAGVMAVHHQPLQNQGYVTPYAELKRAGLVNDTGRTTRTGRGVPKDVLESMARADTMMKGIRQMSTALRAGIGGKSMEKDMKTAMRGLDSEMKHLDVTVRQANTRAIIPMAEELIQLKGAYRDIIPDVKDFDKWEDKSSSTTDRFLSSILGFEKFEALRHVLGDGHRMFSDLVNGLDSVGHHLGAGKDDLMSFGDAMLETNKILGWSKYDLFSFTGEIAKSSEELGLAAVGNQALMQSFDALAQAGVRDKKVFRDLVPRVAALSQVTGMDQDGAANALYQWTQNAHLSADQAMALELSFKKLGSTYQASGKQLENMAMDTKNLVGYFTLHGLGDPATQLQAQENIAKFTAVLSDSFLKDFDLPKLLDEAVAPGGQDTDAFKTVSQIFGGQLAGDVAEQFAKKGGAIDVMRQMTMRFQSQINDTQRLMMKPGATSAEFMQVLNAAQKSGFLGKTTQEWVNFVKVASSLPATLGEADKSIVDVTNAQKEAAEQLDRTQHAWTSMFNTLGVKGLGKFGSETLAFFDKLNWELLADAALVTKLGWGFGVSLLGGLKKAGTGIISLIGWLGGASKATETMGENVTVLTGNAEKAGSAWKGLGSIIKGAVIVAEIAAVTEGVVTMGKAFAKARQQGESFSDSFNSSIVAAYRLISSFGPSTKRADLHALEQEANDLWAGAADLDRQSKLATGENVTRLQMQEAEVMKARLATLDAIAAQVDRMGPDIRQDDLDAARAFISPRKDVQAYITKLQNAIDDPNSSDALDLSGGKQLSNAEKNAKNIALLAKMHGVNPIDVITDAAANATIMPSSTPGSVSLAAPPPLTQSQLGTGTVLTASPDVTDKLDELIGHVKNIGSGSTTRTVEGGAAATQPSGQFHTMTTGGGHG